MGMNESPMTKFVPRKHFGSFLPILTFSAGVCPMMSNFIHLRMNCARFLLSLSPFEDAGAIALFDDI